MKLIPNFIDKKCNLNSPLKKKKKILIERKVRTTNLNAP